MKFKTTFLLAILLMTATSFLQAQDQPVKPTRISTGTFLGETKPLRDYPPLTAQEQEEMKQRALEKAARKKIEPREYPFSATALPKGPDPVWQNTMGKVEASKAPLLNFEGQTTGSYPPDCNGTVGPNHYVQTINLTYAIYNKSGTLLAGPTAMNTLFTGVTGATYNNGDPLIHWDEQAQRWVAVEFSVGGANDFMLVAVSTTNDPTGTWYKYSFDVADMPDYEKIGVWHDGYYMATNTGTGTDVYVMERSKMLLGQPAQMIAFDNPWRPGFGFMLVPPLDNDGTAAPAGTPGTFIAFNDDAVGGGIDQLWLYELNANWTTPASSTFNRVQQLNVSAFDSQFTQDWNDIAQPNGQRLDGVPAVIMNAPQYRNFGSYQTIVCCHSVDINNTNQAGVRWYELRKTPPATTWTLRQEGTYAPDAHSRWMGSIMLNGAGKLGMAYSISSSTEYPGIRYCGQSLSAYTAATGVMDITESVIHTGTAAQTTYNRWGDYALLSVDPVDDQTFWFTSQYLKVGSTKGTKIASFRFTNVPVATTMAASNITATSASLNGKINPNSLATNYYFEWGTTTAYGNTTSTLSAGSGLTDVAVNAGITGLVSGTTYHFRVVGVNSDGTTYGQDLTFTYGTAVVTTAPITNLGAYSATCGGNVTSDGGKAVTARGVCWATTINPVVTGNHTTDGSGTGVFTSSMTGLLANKTYHVRAYATNADGTFYGPDLIFATYCGFNNLPFSESFTAASSPECWTQVDIFGDGYVWDFGTRSGPALTGNYAVANDAGNSGIYNVDLITPTINCTGFANITLQFKHYYNAGTGASGTLSYSVDNGATWSAIQTYSTSTANPATFNQVIASAAGQSQVKFKWNYTGTNGNYWAVDDVSVTGTDVSMPLLTTTAASAITANTAATGGNITSSGTSPVIERGVCWGTTANPTIAGNHTSDGSGTGVFSSSLTGLSPLTTYHIRAYATNSSGTSYGNDLTFSTPCGIIAAFPWNEGFENAGAIPNCWTQEQVASSGINWAFITGNGATNPSAAHGGTYDACLKDATAADNKTRLITPPINLSLITNPTLKFWHFMQRNGTGVQDQLLIYYKTSSGGTWTLLQSYTTNTNAWTERTISLPGASTEYYIAFEGNAKNGRGVVVDDVSITGTTPQWTGATSTDWSTAGNWDNSFVPTSLTNITIPSAATRFPTISASGLQCANLTINNGGIVTIAPTGSLTVNGTLTNSTGSTGLVIKSNASGTGSLITNTAGVSATVERYLTGSTIAPLPWHYLSAPVSGQSIQSFVNALSGIIATNGVKYGLAPYINSGTAPNWVPYTTSTLAGAGNFTVAKGYEILLNTSNTTSFAGTLSAANTPIAVTSPSPGNAWNLVGNPFSSALYANVNAMAVTNFLDVNTSMFESGYKALYFWDAATGTFKVINNATAASYIPLGQAFFVKSAAGGSTANFNANMRTHSTASYNKNTQASWPSIELIAAVAGKKSSTLVYFIPGATTDLDEGYDAGVFNTGLNDNAINSRIEGREIDLAIQSLPETEYSNMVLPIGLNAPQGATITFRAEINDLPANVKVYLKDKFNGVSTRLDIPGSTYTVTLNDASTGTGRFYLNSSQLLVENNPDPKDDFKVIPLPKIQKIRLTGDFIPGSEAHIYDMNGRLISKEILEGFETSEIPFAPGSDGIYLLKIENGSTVITKKIVWVTRNSSSGRMPTDIQPDEKTVPVSIPDIQE